MVVQRLRFDDTRDRAGAHAAAIGRVLELGEVGDDGLRIELLPIGEAHVVTKLERVSLTVVGDLVFGRKPGNVATIYGTGQQRLIGVAQQQLGLVLSIELRI